MAPKSLVEPNAKARAATSLRLADEMQRLDKRIDRAEMGSPERLALLREQATLSDRREWLRDRARRARP